VDDDALLDRWPRRFGPAGTAALAQELRRLPWRVARGSNSPGACGVICAGNPELPQAGWRPEPMRRKPRSQSVDARHATSNGEEVERSCFGQATGATQSTGPRVIALLLRSEAVG
jgi:hypothetical protein